MNFCRRFGALSLLLGLAWPRSRYANASRLLSKPLDPHERARLLHARLRLFRECVGAFRCGVRTFSHVSCTSSLRSMNREIFERGIFIVPIRALTARVSNALKMILFLSPRRIDQHFLPARQYRTWYLDQLRSYEMNILEWSCCLMLVVEKKHLDSRDRQQNRFSIVEPDI